MQQTETGELKSCSVEDSAKRCTVVPIMNANSILVSALRAMWANKTPEDAFEILKQGDVTVTNQSDKEQQLPKIMLFDDDVRAWLRGHVPVLSTRTPTVHTTRRRRSLQRVQSI